LVESIGWIKANIRKQYGFRSFKYHIKHILNI